jgi:molybdenum cofactor cytidylyltransferase
MMRQHSAGLFVGILLAAGKGTRFDPGGARNKLAQSLRGGGTVLAASAKNLKAAVPTVLAVVRPGMTDAADELELLGCEIVECPSADEGMAASLVCALSETDNAEGWVIALADMPYVQPSTIVALVEAIRNGADIAIPTYQGRRGNPVAFSRKHLPSLLRLTGDQGARNLIATLPVTELATGDAGIRIDIDTVADLESRNTQAGFSNEAKPSEKGSGAEQ